MGYFQFQGAFQHMPELQPQYPGLQSSQHIPELQPQNPGLQSSQQGRVGNTFEGPIFPEVTLSNRSQQKPSYEDLSKVQNLIEWGILQYMTKKAIVQALMINANVEPPFTISVWQKLEEANQAFFKNYYARLEVIKQIKLYNRLLEYQDFEMKRLGVRSEPVPNLIQPFPAFTSKMAGSAGLHPVLDNGAGQGQNQLNFNLPDAGSSGSHQIAPLSPFDADFMFDFTQLENTGPNSLPLKKHPVTGDL